MNLFDFNLGGNQSMAGQWGMFPAQGLAPAQGQWGMFPAQGLAPAQGQGGMFSGFSDSGQTALKLAMVTDILSNFAGDGKSNAVQSVLPILMQSRQLNMLQNQRDVAAQYASGPGAADMTPLTRAMLASGDPGGAMQLMGQMALKKIQGPKNQIIRMPGGGVKVADLNKEAGTVYPPRIDPNQLLGELQRWGQVKKPVWDAVQSYQVVLDLMDNPDSGILDYGILIKAIKALDPGSAVMAGEAEAAQRMVSVQDTMFGVVEKLRKGGLKAPEAREQLAELAKTAATVALKIYNKKLAGRRDVYESIHMDPAQIDAILQKIVPPWDEGEDLYDQFGLEKK